MGKIYVKTKYDNTLGMDIPHSINIATAMYGFRELGADMVPYHTIDDIYDVLTEEDIVLDYITQCNEVFHKFGKEPHMEDYPENFERFLGRKVWKDTINNIATNEEKWSAGYFVKPIKSKVFTGKIISSIKDLIGCGSCYEDYDVLVSEPLNIKAEWRCFILYDEIVDIRSYGMLLDKNSYMFHYDEKTVNEMLEEFRNIPNRPAACSMDICVTEDGRTLLVEFNDAYALGCYGLNPVSYAKMISARWSQIMEKDDEYKF